MGFNKLLIFTTVVAVALIFVGSTFAQFTSTVTIPNVGTLQGASMGYPNVTVNSFVGVPYAAPPVGNLRFTYPQNAGAFNGVFDATRYGNICPQLLNGQFAFPNQNLSEDCLNLNIWAPSSPGLKPVLFWLHAGGFIQGSGSEYRYHGANLAAQEGIVVVTINYRLGALGTIAHPSLYASYNYTGDYTLADQAFALNWVSQNIQYFGGDNTQITVGGISAGGAGVSFLLDNPMYSPLINKAILQSSDPLNSQSQSMAQGLTMGVQTASLLLCNGTDAQIISCLRNTSTDALINLAAYRLVAKATIGTGMYLPVAPYESVVMNMTKDVPTYFGNTLSEFALFVYGSQSAPVSQAAYGPFLTNELMGYLPGVNAFSVINTYPCASYNASDCRAAAAVATSDATVFCQQSFFVDRVADYGYLFSYRSTGESPLIPGVPHLSDVPYHFNSLSISTFNYTAQDQAVADVVSRYFGAFIRTGSPSHAGQPTAPPSYQQAGNPRINFDSATPSLVSGFKTLDEAPACGYWASVYAELAAAEMIMMMTNSSSAEPQCTPCPAVPTPTPCPVASPMPSSSPYVCVCPVEPTPCPSMSMSASASCAPSTPSSCSSCSGSGSSSDDDDSVSINFYFADMLRGAGSPNPSGSYSDRQDSCSQ